MQTPWKLSPSDLTFLWDECPRCFYLKVVHKFYRPRAPFPSIFGRIDKLMKDYYEGKPTSDITSELPDGHVKFGEKWVTSDLISIPGHQAACYIRGKFDTLVEFDDGAYGVIDFKTTQPKPNHVGFYSRQLHAYAYALENPAANSLSISPITRLGLLCVEPVLMDMTPEENIAYIGDVTWLEIPKKDEQFLEFLDGVLSVLEQPTPPNKGARCSYCQYREESRSTGY